MSKEQNLEDKDKALHIADVSKFDWQQFLDYVNSYDPKRLANDKADVIVKDLLYGIGISLDDSFKFADGYKRFIDDLKELIMENLSKSTKGNNANTLLAVSYAEIEEMAHKNFPYGSKMPIGSRDRSLYENRKEAFIAGFKACCNYREQFYCSSWENGEWKCETQCLRCVGLEEKK